MRKSVRKSQGNLFKISQNLKKNVSSQEESIDANNSTENLKPKSSQNQISEETVEQLEISEQRFESKNKHIRPPSPSLAMLNDLERSDLTLYNSIIALTLESPPPPPPLPSFFN